MSKKVLLIAHVPSPNTIALAKAAVQRVNSHDTGNVVMQFMSPFDVRASHVIEASAVIIGTTENIGYRLAQRICSTDVTTHGLRKLPPNQQLSIYDGTATTNALISIFNGLVATYC